MKRWNKVAALGAALAMAASPALAHGGGGWSHGGMNHSWNGGMNHNWGGGGHWHNWGGGGGNWGHNWGGGGHWRGGHWRGGHWGGGWGWGWPLGFGLGVGFADPYGPYGYYYPDDYYDDGAYGCGPVWDPAVGGYVPSC